jgi:hypothetical protein
MKDILQMLKDAIPLLRDHPVFALRVFLCLVLLGVLYRAREIRKRLCQPLLSKLSRQIQLTNRWLYVYQDSQTDAWKYYTSEVTGIGDVGDDVIWTQVSWPSLRPVDSFKVQGAVGMLNGVHESQAKLLARWHIVHDPDRFGVGPVPARGLKSRLRRIFAKLLHTFGSNLSTGLSTNSRD